jgi:predicted O-methyltransferase YrrM
MEPLNENLAENIDAYIQYLFVPDDAVLTENLSAAASAGLPAIQVSPNQGKLLESLVVPIIRHRIDGLSISIVKDEAPS